VPEQRHGAGIRWVQVAARRKPADSNSGRDIGVLVETAWRAPRATASGDRVTEIAAFWDAAGQARQIGLA
jgi:hypothetical protein